MKLGIVGLGRMGAAMSERLRGLGFEVIGWDQKAETNKRLAAEGLRIAANARADLAELPKFFREKLPQNF